MAYEKCRLADRTAEAFLPLLPHSDAFDIVEDCDGWGHERVEREFGADVRSIVAELTEDKSLGWEERKQAGIDHAHAMSPPALAVKAADKLHNLRTLIADLRTGASPERVWARFRGGRERTLMLSRALVAELEPRVEARLGRALREAIDELERLARP